MGRQTSLIAKRINRATYGHGDFLVVEDVNRPSTWRLRVSTNGVPSERLMRQQYAYLTKGFAGRKYTGPQKEQAMSKLRSMFRQMNRQLPGAKPSEAAAPVAQTAKVGKPLQESELLEVADQDLEEGVGSVYLDGDVPSVPWGVTSFEALLAADEAKEDANEVMVLAYQLTRLVENIVNAPEVQDKLGAITNVVNEFMTLATDALSPSTTEESKPLGADSSEAAKPKAEGEQLAESFGGLIDLAEAGEAPTSGVPLTMTVGIIKPGWGNEADKHYYPAEVLRRDAGVFAGSKMYETDHKESERSTRTWVSTIESIQGFAEDGSPIAKVIVHDPTFAEKVRALKAAGMLDKMECSILAQGRAKPGQVDGKQANVVEAITAAHAVDWVTRAGAGGRALDLSESATAAQSAPQAPETEEPKPAQAADAAAETPVDAAATTEPDAAGSAGPAGSEDPTTGTADAGQEAPKTPVKDGEAKDEQLADQAKASEAAAPAGAVVFLSEAEISGALDRTRLPSASRARLARYRYASISELDHAIDEEIRYVKELTGSGQPIMQTGPAPSQPVVTAETQARNVAAINARYLGR